ncbi:MAG TPA: hypothetical protein VMF06_24675 [Candidatus Limnocylindria bacterium]|jgi:hypothetical protein|nr:hypothetical protein [Candidatus Limnocylindria bacterium]
MDSESVRPYLLVSGIPLLVGTLWWLGVMLCRAWVKSELLRLGFTPLRVRWRFFASDKMSCHFQVECVDDEGTVRRNRCSVGWMGGEVVWHEAFEEPGQGGC